MLPLCVYIHMGGRETQATGRQNYGCNLHNEILASKSYTMRLRDLGVRHFHEPRDVRSS